MNKLTLSVALIVGLGAASQAVAADQLLVTSGLSKAGNSGGLALDLVSDGKSRGIQARIVVPKGVQVDTSECLTSLPAGFNGVCKQSGNEVRLMAFAFEKQTLPEGMISVGTLRLSSNDKRGIAEGELEVVDFQSVNVDGAGLEAKATVSGSASSRHHGSRKNIDPSSLD